MAEVTKRSVSTDALETLGTIIGAKEKRDAIHLAVIPVIAGARLYPGQSINASADGIASPASDGLGIVDPFLAGAVHPEQRFWMVLRPRLVTSLRHVWSHPAFPDELGAAPASDASEKAAARAALEVIADNCDSTVEDMVAGAHSFLDHSEYMIDGGRWEGIYVPEEFWPHFEVLTGRKVPSADRENFFSCAC